MLKPLGGNIVLYWYLIIRYMYLENRYIYLENRYIYLENRYIYLENRYIYLENWYLYLEYRYIYLEIRYIYLVEWHGGIKYIKHTVDAIPFASFQPLLWSWRLISPSLVLSTSS